VVHANSLRTVPEESDGPPKLNARGRKALEWLARNPGQPDRAFHQAVNASNPTLAWLQVNGLARYDKPLTRWVITELGASMVA
jgi:hypothetical protein